MREKIRNDSRALGLFDWIVGGATKEREHSKKSFLCYHCKKHLLSTCYEPHTFIIQWSYEIRIITVLKSTYWKLHLSFKELDALAKVIQLEVSEPGIEPILTP